MPDLHQRRAEVVDAFDAALAPRRFTLSDERRAAPYAVAGGTPLADFAPVRAALGRCWTRAWSRSRSSGSAPCCARRSCRRPRPKRAQRRSWMCSCASAARSEADLAGWLTARRANCGCARHRRGCRPAAAAGRAAGAGGGARQPAHEPLGRRVDSHALDSGPWSLRHRWSSIEYQAAERFRELLAANSPPPMRFSARIRDRRRSASCGVRRMTRHFKRKPASRRYGSADKLMDPWLNYEGSGSAAAASERWPPPVEPIALLPVTVQRDFGVIAAAPESQLQFALELQSRWAARAASMRIQLRRPRRRPCRRAQSAAAAQCVRHACDPALPRPHWHALLQARPAARAIDG